MGVLKFLLFLAAAYACVVGAMFVFQDRMLFPGAGRNDADARSVPWGEAVSIATPDGETLDAQLTPASAGRPTLLFFHGNADDIARYGFLARALANHGIGLLAVSYRGYGRSTGTPGEAGLLVDGLAAYDWLARRAKNPIAILGQSLGSGVAVHVASQRPASGVVLVSPYTSVLAVAQSAYPFVPVAPLLKHPFRSDLAIGGVAQPKLFIHGRRDRVIPLRFGKALFSLAPEPKRMLVPDNHGHNDIWSDATLDAVADFAEEIAAGN